MDSGVLRGCPPCGSWYEVAAIVFLLDLEQCLGTASSLLGVTRSCADDLGAVILKNTGRPRLVRVFRRARRFANLVLKPKKCFVMHSRGP
eukprot:9389749-Pyramimonas_sp.AAC.1